MPTMTPFFKKHANLYIIGIPGRDHNSIQLEIHHRKKNEKEKITWRLNNMLLKY